MNPDGSDQTLISNGGYHYDPAWSADGQRIAFAWADNSDSDAWVASGDGRNRIQVTSGAAYDFSPAWSPDGHRIALDRYELPEWYETDVFVVDTAGGEPIDLTDHPGEDSHPKLVPRRLEDRIRLEPFSQRGVRHELGRKQSAFGGPRWV